MKSDDQTENSEIAEISQSKLPDEEVLKLSVKKPSAFEVIVDRYQAAFLRKLTPMFRGFEDDASDIVQEAFVKIYINAGRFKPQPGATFKSWAYKVLLNTAFTFLKKKRRLDNLLR